VNASATVKKIQQGPGLPKSLAKSALFEYSYYSIKMGKGRELDLLAVEIADNHDWMLRRPVLVSKIFQTVTLNF